MARSKMTGEVPEESGVDLASIASRSVKRRRRRHRLREQRIPSSPLRQTIETVEEVSESRPPPTPILRPLAGDLEIPPLSLPDPTVLTYSRVVEEDPVVEPTSNDSGDSSEAETIIAFPQSAPKIPVKSTDIDKMKSASASSVSSGQSAKPLTYTTVGSVVNADETPTFAPPVRIHREGANRRPSGSLGQNRNAFDSHTSRIHAQNLRSNYTHQQSFVDHGHFNDLTKTSYSSLNSKVSLAGIDPNSSLTQDEQAVPQNQGTSVPHQRNADSHVWSRPSFTSSSFSTLSNITNNKNQDPAQSISSPEMGIRDQARGGLQRGVPAPPTGIAGLNPLNKMQSLQRLAQYPNPMQDMAKNRLAEFLVSRSQPLNSQPLKIENTSPRGLPPLVHNVPPRGKDTDIGKNLIMALERYDPKGELEMNYRFPNPLPTQSSTTYSNDTFNDSSSTLSPRTMSSSTAHDIQTPFPTLTRSYPQTQQGYPKPLTAGPPGQRFANNNNNEVILQYNQGRPARPNSGASRQALVSLQDIVESHAKKESERNKELDDDELMKQPHKHRMKELSDDEILEQLRKYTPQTSTATAFKNPWNDESPSPRPFANNGVQPKIYDTSTPADILKYYKGGIPSDYNYEKPPSPIFPSSAATFDSAFLHPQHTSQQTSTAPANPWNKPNPATVSTSQQNWYGSVGQPTSGQLTSGQTGTTNPSDGWWYSGLRRIGMTAEEHVQEFENKKWRFENGYPEPTPLPGTATDHKPISMEQINQMDIPEMMEDLLNPAFGTMLSLADPNPNPAASFNRFRPTEDCHRDTTAAGNNSLFGEDWGVTPGQARHQQHMDTIEKANEASVRFLVNNPPKPVVPDWKNQAAEGQKEGRQLWKKHQSTEPKWIGPHGFSQERGLDRGFDIAGMVDFERGGIMKVPAFPPMRLNKKPAQKVGMVIVPPTIKKNDGTAGNLATSVTPRAQSSETNIVTRSTKTTDAFST